jgi:23S rRNA pseudouridine955/2504/2580 synthase
VPRIAYLPGRMSAVTTRTVAEDEAEIRLDRWFRRHFPGLAQGAIHRLCRTGQIRVDGKRAEAATRLSAGAEIRVPPLPEHDPPERQTVTVSEREAKDLHRLILYRDDHLIVLNKPSGLPVQGGPGIVRSLDHMLDAFRFGHPERPRLVHRLDRDTSGVLAIARSAAAAASLAAAFRGRDAEKTYWAVVVGLPVPLEGRIDAALARAPGPRGERTRLAEKGEDEAARAITDYVTLDKAGRRAAWLELKPLTGRTHQLRVHCAGLGTPILGDEKYGTAGATLEGFAPRLHLHARALRIPHPAGGVVEVAAELPPHMAETFRGLGFTAPRTPAPRRTGR